MAHNSLEVEMQEFFEDIRLKRKPSASLSDAYEALKVVNQIYRISGYDYSA